MPYICSECWQLVRLTGDGSPWGAICPHCSSRFGITAWACATAEECYTMALDRDVTDVLTELEIRTRLKLVEGTTFIERRVP